MSHVVRGLQSPPAAQRCGQQGGDVQEENDHHAKDTTVPNSSRLGRARARKADTFGMAAPRRVGIER